MEANLAKRKTSTSSSPFLTDVYYDTQENRASSGGKVNVRECLRLYRALGDHKNLPASCKDYVVKHLQMQKAFEGAGGNLAAEATIVKHATGGKGLTNAQLKRRLTSSRDPFANRK